MKKLILSFLLIADILHIRAQTVDLHRYDSLKAQYLAGKKDIKTMPGIALTANTIKDRPFGDTVAIYYLDHYLKQEPSGNYLTRENLELITVYERRPESNAFRIFYNHPEKIDSAAGRPGFANFFIDRVISYAEIDPMLWKDRKPRDLQPDWPSLEMKIAKKYQGETAKRVVLDARIKWYEYHKDTTQLVDCYAEKMDRYGIDTAGMGKGLANNIIYYIIFLHSDDSAILQKAAHWMEMLMHAEPSNAEFIDTYANLLYKMGKMQQAMAFESKASIQAPDSQDIQNNYLKMKRGEKTW